MNVYHKKVEFLDGKTDYVEKIRKAFNYKRCKVQTHAQGIWYVFLLVPCVLSRPEIIFNKRYVHPE